MGKICVFLTAKELFLYRSTKLRIIEPLIYRVEASEIGYELKSGLFAYSRNPGYIVGRISHQSLDVNKLLGLDSVGFLKERPVKARGLLRFYQKHAGFIVYKLKRITVTRKNIRLNIPLNSHSRKRTENIICLVALKRYNLASHTLHTKLCIRKLNGKLIRHSLSGGLIALVHFMPEGRSLQIKRYRAIIGLQRGYLPFNDICHSVNRVSIKTVFVGQQSYTVKGSV